MLRAQARAVVAYHAGNYQELFQLLESRPYHESSHAELQALWFAGQYAAAQARTSLLVLVAPFWTTVTSNGSRYATGPLSVLSVCKVGV